MWLFLQGFRGGIFDLGFGCFYKGWKYQGSVFFPHRIDVYGIYTYLHESLIFMVNVGEYMEPLGYGLYIAYMFKIKNGHIHRTFLDPSWVFGEHQPWKVIVESHWLSLWRVNPSLPP